ncbi:hypothetical protein B0T18DRAFT_397828 [Schizothecium vesticola]|uniref:Secreted protein n=1 Tax=Schizothecium vesticola TaxID=314040 RepID=A0AA40KCH6_9PEZI|nr:hypothetical protein B0T18DRAFT_397828 [Schizothecium vesticola]
MARCVARWIRVAPQRGWMLLAGLGPVSPPSLAACPSYPAPDPWMLTRSCLTSLVSKTEDKSSNNAIGGRVRGAPAGLSGLGKVKMGRYRGLRGVVMRRRREVCVCGGDVDGPFRCRMFARVLVGTTLVFVRRLSLFDVSLSPTVPSAPGDGGKGKEEPSRASPAPAAAMSSSTLTIALVCTVGRSLPPLPDRLDRAHAATKLERDDAILSSLGGLPSPLMGVCLSYHTHTHTLCPSRRRAV